MKSPAIQIENMSLSFNSQVVLGNFNLSVMPGEKVLIMGKSGSGKSSILRAILGFIMIQKGTCRIDGLVADHKTIWQIRSRIGYVPQEPQLGQGSTLEFLRRPFSYKSNSGLYFDIQKVNQLCEQFLLSPTCINKDISSLSGGEKQRVALIGALILDRPIYCFDEITSALDEQSRTAVLNYIRSRSDMTALMVSHDMSLVSVVDEIVRLGSNGSEEGL